MVVRPRSSYSRQSYRTDRAESAAAAARVEGLLAQLCQFSEGDPDRVLVRTEVIEACIPMATRLARRYAGRGEATEDLTQVALLGLITAVDGFDLSRGVPFGGYAAPTILGALKRHFRDTTWSVRVPRRIQELKLTLTVATEELTSTLHRSPTAAELAALLGITTAEVRAGLLGANSHRAVSLDSARDGSGTSLADMLGASDPRIEAVDRHDALKLGLAAMPERDRRIIGLRFYAEMTQAQIATEMGVSQMHVSRLLAGALAHLRVGLLDDDGHHNVRPSGSAPSRPSAPRRVVKRTPAV